MEKKRDNEGEEFTSNEVDLFYRSLSNSSQMYEEPLVLEAPDVHRSLTRTAEAHSVGPTMGGGGLTMSDNEFSMGFDMSGEDSFMSGVYDQGKPINRQFDQQGMEERLDLASKISYMNLQPEPKQKLVPVPQPVQLKALDGAFSVRSAVGVEAHEVLTSLQKVLTDMELEFVIQWERFKVKVIAYRVWRVPFAIVLHAAPKKEEDTCLPVFVEFQQHGGKFEIFADLFVEIATVLFNTNKIANKPTPSMRSKYFEAAQQDQTQEDQLPKIKQSAPADEAKHDNLGILCQAALTGASDDAVEAMHHLCLLSANGATTELLATVMGSRPDEEAGYRYVDLMLAALERSEADVFRLSITALNNLCTKGPEENRVKVTAQIKASQVALNTITTLTTYRNSKHIATCAQKLLVTVMM